MTCHLLAIDAAYYRHISDLLYQGASRAAAAAGAKITRIFVPGALEIPTALALIANSGGSAQGLAANGNGGQFDAYVALGCVIRGETSHYDIVAQESARALINLAIAQKIAIGNAILTVDTESQALTRADMQKGDKGGTAVCAALRLLDIKRGNLHSTDGES